jgi:hypothetical protein
VTDLFETLVARIDARRARPISRPARPVAPASDQRLVVVTGARGFLGAEIVRAFFSVNCERNAPVPPVLAVGLHADCVPLIVTFWFAAAVPRPGLIVIVPATFVQLCSVVALAGAAANPTIPAANATPNVMLANRRYRTPSLGLENHVVKPLPTRRPSVNRGFQCRDRARFGQTGRTQGC